ncbi:MAG: YebC/PmpR family DNA-binding transcriptional regulator [Candidatus Moranbacteria bacterium CG_4_9_14_3_um_filter_42_9]|nr:MAG: YebC/PmpR family DNA-binding transcriptional regulator [Candidatus Moranbacteria bacterium CG_4_9_14_3_um_filter_42_9]
MSGHSHWAGIKHRKGLNDATRAKIFTKHGKLITIAARSGDGNPDTNFQLRLAIERARAENMPKENIERSIKRGTGELKDGVEIQEVLYEAYGPGQIAMLIKAATDNKNRTLGELKTLLMKNGGKMVPAGSVSYLFKLVGNINITVEKDDDISDLELQVIEAGAEDTIYSDGILTLYTRPEELQKTREALGKKGLKIADAGLVWAPIQKTTIDASDKLGYENLLELLDDQDDVQEIYDNL